VTATNNISGDTGGNHKPVSPRRIFAPMPENVERLDFTGTPTLTRIPRRKRIADGTLKSLA